MPDIIQGAKELLKLVDEERADLESRGAEPDEYGGFEMWLDATVLYGSAKEVRESIKALAEESYEYIVQVKCANAWQFYVGESHMVSDNPGAAYGFNLRSNALEFSKMETTRPTRIVRRRVSPPEVINE